MSLSPSMKTGKVKISSPVVDQGAGVLTVIVEVVGQELQVPADEIELNSNRQHHGAERRRRRRQPGDAGLWQRRL